MDKPTTSSRDCITVILPPTGLGTVNLREIWRYRELLGTLVWRDLKVRYRQTLLGAVWVIGQPLIMVAIFTLIFQRVAGMSLESGVPYSLFVFTGLVPWQFFANGVQNAGVSILGSTQLVSKVYFPRLIIPAAPILGALIDLLVVSCAVLVVQLCYGWVPSPLALAYLPFAALILVALTFGIGCWMAALNVNYRDVRVVMPFLLQFGMFATPVLYPVGRLPVVLQPIAALNPMTGVLELIRGGMLGESVAIGNVLATAFLSIVLLITGVMAFTRMERQFADVM